MNKKCINFTCLALLCAGSVFAADISVNPDNFIEKWNEANDGDVLVMESGTYLGEYSLQKDKAITLEAAEGAAVILAAGPSSSADATDAGFIVNGVTIHLEKNDYFMRSDVGEGTWIEVNNCVLESINRCFLYNQGGGAIKSIVFDNCIIRNGGSKDYNFIWAKTTVEHISITNSTLYNYTGECIFWRNGASRDTDFSFVFENNTVYKWSKGNNGETIYALCKTEDQYSAQSTYVFRNNIIAEPGVEGATPLILITKDGIVTCENNLIVNYGGYDISAPGVEPVIRDLTLSDLNLTSIGFANPAEGDFTIDPTSPLATAGENGSCLGDPRWIEGGKGVDPSGISQTIVEAGVVDVYSIDGVLIRRGVEIENAVEGLNKGIYIAGGKKILVK